MNRLGLRGRIFAVSALVVLTAGLLSGSWLYGELEDWTEHIVEGELLRQTATAAALVDPSMATADVAVWDALADELGRTMDARVTFIALDGQVLGDSRLALPAVRTAERHDDRPEVVDARSSDVGASRRHSATLGASMLYVARPLDGSLGIVRVSKQLTEIDAALRPLRVLLGIAALLLLLLGIALAAIASQLSSRALRRLVEHVRALAEGRTPAQALALGTDEVSRLAGTVQELAGELDQKARTLDAERARFEAVLEGMSAAVLGLDGDGRVKVANRAAQQMLGLDRVVVGQKLNALVGTKRLGRLADEARSLGGVASFDFKLKGPPRRWLLARAAPEGEGEGVVVVLHDVTEMRRLERVRRDFVANVSHELRTPVAVIRANSETLLDGALDDPVAARRFLDALHRQSERLGALIDDLLDLARMEAGHYDLDQVPVGLAEPARRCVEGLRERAARGAVSLELDLAPDACVLGDEKAIDQVLLNLVENAVKYHRGDGTVTLRVIELGSVVRVEVQDDGPGIQRKRQKRLFERFYRVDPGRSREAGGTGLGLSIVKHLVEGMGGSVGVESEHGEGSTFFFVLPSSDTGALAPTRPPGADSARQDGMTASPQASAKPSLPLLLVLLAALFGAPGCDPSLNNGDDDDSVVGNDDDDVSDDDDDDVSDDDDDTGTLPFGAECVDGGECVSGLCWDFANYDPWCGGTACTERCESNFDCIDFSIFAGSEFPDGAVCGGDGLCDMVSTGMGSWWCADGDGEEDEAPVGP